MSTPDSGTIDTEAPSLTNTNVQNPPRKEDSPNNDEAEVKNVKVDGEPIGSDKQENNATSKDPLTTEEGEVVTSGNDTNLIENQNTESALSENTTAADGPPLPEEPLPPLPNEQPPAATQEDDGWAPVWDETNQAFYFYNRFTGATQWDNPRVPEAAQPGPPGVPSTDSAVAPTESDPISRPAGGYDPAIHGDYDPNAWYAQSAVEEPAAMRLDPAAAYAATGQFNRFTGRWQAAELNPENFNDENKSKRQMSAYFDVDAAANNHDGRSLKEERSGKKLSKAELKQFKEKRKQKKEEKRRAWLRD
ncbi:hypothetical protein SS1G_01784 [Sclerotinia sclerotiorum 1980 UF-70]|uniref:WW domain-containing protein n=2 Tax=Sclerotinia sclerotiorum (strain ATCC 18683 / 1980 / Ss-1) TaxID=665079 RepID=A7E906_SCLS1|nr:hypothetical protein SS1G_01784 [Sclerotinia sclerotiorum 1980 UF-70]APA05836.1 hypothetical protein sscle_01g006060 [Sclerotinia sclerotiorum 1980 UF-70]EDN96858.1 hypothetical protein SS1G_01784 [Sclerotinia sclerotiorum 1980 UF-70]